MADRPRLVDLVAVYDRLPPEEQAGIGRAALLWVYAGEAMGGRWDHASAAADQLLHDEAHAALEGLREGLTPGHGPPPDLAPFGIRACRFCGCWDASACAGGCRWVEADLCSACAAGRRS